MFHFDILTLKQRKFNPLQIVSRYHEPQLQVDENYSFTLLTKII